MIYLIELYGSEQKYLKIGYSKSIEERLKQYDTHCAEYKIIDTFEGTIQEEKILLEILNKYIIHNEWMNYNDEIIYLWKLYKILYPKIKELYEDKINKLKHENEKISRELMINKDIIFNSIIKEKINKLLKENEELRKKLTDEITIC